jgi:hypothetical protein
MVCERVGSNACAPDMDSHSANGCVQLADRIVAPLFRQCLIGFQAMLERRAAMRI